MSSVRCGPHAERQRWEIKEKVWKFPRDNYGHGNDEKYTEWEKKDV